MTRFPEVLDKIYFVAENGKVINPPKRVIIKSGYPLDTLKRKLQR